MLNGAFALLGRSLRIDARSWPTHVTRLGLVVAIYFALCITLATEDQFGAPGLRFFEGIAYLDLVFMTLLGLGFFSTPITEEKEEDTLGLMLMAGISPLGILAGKSGGRVGQALLLVAVQFPLMMLAVTMGGITPVQIIAVTMALLAYMLLLAGFGLLCSTLASSSRKASGWVIVGLVLYFFVSGIAAGISGVHTRWIAAGGEELSLPKEVWVFLEAVSNVSVFLRLMEILSTGFSESAWSFQVITNAAMGLVCALLSWLLFGVATRHPATEATSRGLVARRRAFFRFPAGRPRINPFVWKDFHFVSGGVGMIFVRIIYYGSMALVVWAYDFIRGSPAENEYVTGCLLWMSFSIAVDAAMMLSRSMHDEVRGETLTSLMMLPHSSTAMVYSKFAGALLGWLPGPIFQICFALSTQVGRRDLWGLLWNQYDSWLIILLFALIPHFAALVSLYVRWGAVPLAIGMTIAVYFSLFVVVIFFEQTNANNNLIAMWIFGLWMLALCVGCHIGVLLRVQALGAR